MFYTTDKPFVKCSFEGIRFVERLYAVFVLKKWNSGHLRTDLIKNITSLLCMQRVLSLHLGKYPELVETITTYNAIVNQHINLALQLKTLSKIKLHKELYSKMRIHYPLFPSALIQCARDQAVEMLKGNKFKPCTKKRLTSSIRFDLRTAKVFLMSKQLQLTTIQGRKKYSLKIPTYFSQYVDWKVKGVTLGIDKKRLRLKVIVQGEKPDLIPYSSIIGIDVGLNNFAVLSNGVFIKSKYIRKNKRRYAYLRKGLQSKGTRTAKKHLKELSGRERRFTTHFNHTVSKKIAELPCKAFALEDLKGIRNSRRGTVFNRKRSNWSYGQFRNFLMYKAEQHGKQVILVDPKYTSQTCSYCDFVAKESRNKGEFHCVNCGWRCSADLNASYNISQKGMILFEQAAVNQPYISNNEAKALFVN